MLYAIHDEQTKSKAIFMKHVCDCMCMCVDFVLCVSMDEVFVTTIAETASSAPVLKAFQYVQYWVTLDLSA